MLSDLPRVTKPAACDKAVNPESTLTFSALCYGHRFIVTTTHTGTTGETGFCNKHFPKTVKTEYCSQVLLLCYQICTTGLYKHFRFLFFHYNPIKSRTLLKTSLLMASMFHRHILSLCTRASSFCRHSSSRCLSSDTAVCALACSWSRDSELCRAKLPSFCWASARFHLHATELFTNSFCFWQASSIPWLYIWVKNNIGRNEGGNGMFMQHNSVFF